MLAHGPILLICPGGVKPGRDPLRYPGQGASLPATHAVGFPAMQADEPTREMLLNELDRVRRQWEKILE